MPHVLFDKNSKSILFDGKDGIIKLNKFNKLPIISESYLSYPFECFLGVLDTEKGKHLFFCSESNLIGTYEEVKYHKISKIQYLPLECESNTNDDAESVRILIESLGFYYTFEEVEEHFFWNANMLLKFKEDIEVKLGEYNSHKTSVKKTVMPSTDHRSPFIKQSAVKTYHENPKIVLPTGKIFCGYFETQTVWENGILNFLKIQSKISIKKIGARMLSRGVDNNGNVSFFVETKFTVKNDNERNEFVILRGSVPLYWSQNDPLKPKKIQLEGSYEENKDAFNKHFNKLIGGYGRIIVVDLLSGIKYEHALSQLYKELCEARNIEYIHFDLNKHVKDYETLKSILYGRIEKCLNNSIKSEDSEKTDNSANSKIKDSFRSFCISENMLGSSFKPGIDDSSTESVELKDDLDDKEYEDDDENLWEPESSVFTSFRSGLEHKFKDLRVVFRVNCMDCLDRTNLCQYLLFSFSQPYNFKAIKAMWANNGNALSNMYTGSNALKSDLPSKGKITFFGKVNDFVISANRMLNNKFTDKDKQQAIDLLLGKNAR